MVIISQKVLVGSRTSPMASPRYHLRGRCHVGCCLPPGSISHLTSLLSSFVLQIWDLQVLPLWFLLQKELCPWLVSDGMVTLGDKFQARLADGHITGQDLGRSHWGPEVLGAICPLTAATVPVVTEMEAMASTTGPVSTCPRLRSQHHQQHPPSDRLVSSTFLLSLHTAGFPGENNPLSIQLILVSSCTQYSFYITSCYPYCNNQTLITTCSPNAHYHILIPPILTTHQQSTLHHTQVKFSTGSIPPSMWNITALPWGQHSTGSLWATIPLITSHKNQWEPLAEHLGDSLIMYMYINTYSRERYQWWYIDILITTAV